MDRPIKKRSGMKNFALILLAALSISGCATNSYQAFYTQNLTPDDMTKIDALKPGEEPKLLYSQDMDRDYKTLRSKNYVVIGHSSFNGGLEHTDNAIAQAKAVGASVILVNTKYTNTLTTNSTLLLPDNKTTYHSGNIYGSGGGYANYSGTSTTYGTTAVPYTTHQDRYDQSAYFLAKSNQKVRFGIGTAEIPPELRAEIERNTGALVDVVMEDMPAYVANIMAGDVLIAVDGRPVKNADHAGEVMRSVPAENKHSDLTIIRKGKERVIRVIF